MHVIIVQERAKKMYEPGISEANEEEVIRRVMQNRVEQIETETPQARMTLEDRGTRAVISVVVKGQIIRTEFIESSLAMGHDDEYLDALRKSGHIALHYPSSHYNDLFVESKASEIRRMALESKFVESMTIDGFTYEHTGQEDRVV
jgi:hypothetical protein